MSRWARKKTGGKKGTFHTNPCVSSVSEGGGTKKFHHRSPSIGRERTKPVWGSRLKGKKSKLEEVGLGAGIDHQGTSSGTAKDPAL